jgi:hypothetical protein
LSNERWRAVFLPLAAILTLLVALRLRFIVFDRSPR